MTIFLPQPSTHGSQPPYQSASTSQQCSNLLLMIRKLSVMDSCQLDETQIPSLGRTVLVLQKVAGQSCQAILHMLLWWFLDAAAAPGTGSSSTRNGASPHRNHLPPLPPDTGIESRCSISIWLALGFFKNFLFQMKWDTDDAFSPFPKPNWSMTMNLCELGSSTPQDVSERLQKLLHRPV